MGLLENKVVLVTGGSSGIGQRTVRMLAGHDATVVFCDIDEQGAEVTRQTDERRRTPGRISFPVMSLRRRRSTQCSRRLSSSMVASTAHQ